MRYGKCQLWGSQLLLLALLASVFFIASCNQEEKRFTEVAEAAGVDNINLLEPNEELNIITYLYYYNGGGVAATDISGDGLPDLYFTNNQGPNRYYINEGNWQFREATEVAKLGGKGDWSTGVSVVDVNRDGLADIYVCNVSGYLGLEGGNELFIQKEDGTFQESAAAYGLDFTGFATQAYWFDFDYDGDLDCYLLCHSVHNDATYGKAAFRQRPDARAGDRLYECTEKDGQISYRQIDPQTSGIFASKIGYGLSAAISDFDRNGRADIYVCNDFSENDYLYLNQLGVTDTMFYQESIQRRMGHSSNFSMGSTVGDFDNDGWPDLFTLDMRPGDPTTLKHTASADPYTVYRIKRGLGYYNQYPRNNLQWNRGGGYFSEIGQQAGVASSDWSWSALAADFDLDGYQDIFVANGILRRPNDLDYLKFLSDPTATGLNNLELANRMSEGLVENVFYHNQGDLTFQDKAAEWGLNLKGSSTGAAYADFDQDGDLDLVLNNLNAPASLYRNNTIGKEGSIAVEQKSISVGETLSATLIDSAFVKFSWLPANGLLNICLEVEGKRYCGFNNMQSGMMSQSDNILTVPIPNEIGSKLASAKLLVDGSYGYDKNWQASISLEGGLARKEVPHNNFVDFDVESLQPYAISNEGPAVALTTIDGYEVVYVGGARGKRLQIAEDDEDLPLLNAQQAGDLSQDVGYEDIDATFFDADGDGDDDLYVVSGGGKANQSAKYFRDRLYLWDEGRFNRCEACLPERLIDNGSCVVTADFDGDGDEDIFAGSRSLPGYYGQSGLSRILLNDGNGKFTEDESWQPKIGMVTDAVWDATTESLIIAAEWSSIKLFNRQDDQWTSQPISPVGLWRCLALSDGTLYAGNWGINSGLGQPTTETPLRLYLGDLDANGKSDPIITQVLGDREMTLADKDEIGAQLPAWKRNNLSYFDFASQDVTENFSAFQLPKPFEVTELRHLKINLSSQAYESTPLSPASQLTCLNDIMVRADEILLAGNQQLTLPRVGRQDAAGLQKLVGGKVSYLAPEFGARMITKLVRLNNGEVIIFFPEL